MAHEGKVFEGKTLDAAVRNGLDSLGLSRAEVMITIIEEGSGGFLGIGARPYRVRVMRRPGGAPMTEPEADERRRRRERPGGRGARNGGSGPRREGRERRGPGSSGPEREGRERRPSGGPPAGTATGRSDAGREEPRREERRRDDRGEPRGERRDEPRGDGGRGGGRLDERGDESRRGRRDERLQERRPEERRPTERGAERRPVERDDERRPTERGEERRPVERGEERRPVERGEERRPVERDDERPVMSGRAGSESGTEGQGEYAGNDESRRRRRRGRRGGRRRHGEAGPDFAPAQGEQGPGHVEVPAMEMEDLAPTPRPEPPVDAPPRDARPGRSEWEEPETRAPREEREERRPRERPATTEAPGLATEELVAQSRRLTEALLGAMGFEATVSATADGNHVDVTAEVAKDEDLLTGRKGEVRQALQHLLNRMLNRGESSRYHLQLEINDFWKRREEELRELAHTLAGEAVASSGEVVTEYLNAQERRIVHVTLREDTRVKTYALGTGMIKRVAIAPADFEGGPRDDDG